MTLAARLLAATLLLAVWVRPCLAQACYRVLKGRETIGTARLTQKLLPDGGKTVELVISLDMSGGPTEVRTRSVFKASGALLRTVSSVTPSGQPPLTEVIADFERTGAHVVKRLKGQPSVIDVPLPLGASTAAPYEFWFLRDQPKEGERCATYTFEPNQLRWEATTVTYVGRTRNGRLVRMERSGRRTETVFDAKGLPVSVEDSTGLRLVRISSGS